MDKKRFQQNLIYSLSIIGFFAIFSTTISKNPVLPLFVKALGSGEAVLGLIAAFSPLAGIVFSFPVGMLSDRIGPKRLLTFAGFIFLISPLLYLVVDNAAYLIPIRFFHGLATAILGPVATTMIFERYPNAKGEKAGIYSSATLIGRTIAPVFGGLLLSYFASQGGFFNFRMVYLTAFVAAIPVLALILMLEEDMKPGKKGKGKREQKRVSRISPGVLLTSFKRFWSDRRMLATALVEMTIYFSFGAFETYLPLLLSSKGFPAYQIGLLFSVQVFSIAMSKPLFGKLSDRIDRRLQIAAGIFVVGACMVLISLFYTFAEIVIISLVFGLGMSFATVATGAYIADISRKDELGASMGALSSIMDVGQTAGPLVTGMIIAASSFFLGFMVSLILTVVIGLFFLATAYSPDPVPTRKETARK
jgi:MFS family permease